MDESGGMSYYKNLEEHVPFTLKLNGREPQRVRKLKFEYWQFWKEKTYKEVSHRLKGKG